MTSVVSGMELRGFPETTKWHYQLFREWSYADFPKQLNGIATDGDKKP
jgi:hypothetical protein